MKRCTGCRVEKPEEFFSKNKSAPDGLQHYCKECVAARYTKNAEYVKAHVREYVAANKEKVRAKGRERYKKNRIAPRPYTSKGRESSLRWKAWYAKDAPRIKQKLAQYREVHKEEFRARSTVRYLVHKGQIVRGVCEVCGQTKTEAHHDDYTKPLEVRWFCRMHHLEHHKDVRRKNWSVVV